MQTGVAPKANRTYMPEKPHYIGHRKRLKQRLEQNSIELADYEILELILGYALPRKDTKPLAKELLKRFGSLGGIYAAKEQELLAVPGIGSGVIVFWKLWREFWVRLQHSNLQQKEIITGPQDVAELAKSRLGFMETEEFWIALVDNKNRLIAFEAVSKGTVDQAPVYPREVMALALQKKAGGMILVHNHPGGDPTPSSQDMVLTSKIAALAKELDIRLLDHLVVAEKKHYSFQEHGLL